MHDALFYHTGLHEHPNAPMADLVPTTGAGTVPGADILSAPTLQAGDAAPERKFFPCITCCATSLTKPSSAALHMPLAGAGHLVSVLMLFSSQVAGPATRGSRLITKKAKVTKSDHIQLVGCSRIDFISKILAVHDLGDQFSPNVHQGPTFKMYWTGSTYVCLHFLLAKLLFLITQNISGGKAGATSIENDRQFLAAVSVITSKTKKCQLGGEFDVDEMDGYHIHTKVSLNLNCLCENTDL
jgi:hypothetical protein